MTIDERIAQVTQAMNQYREQDESIGKQIAQLQQQREALVQIYRKAEGALEVLQQIKNEEAATEKGEAT